jgi:hypothetical protein
MSIGRDVAPAAAAVCALADDVTRTATPTVAMNTAARFNQCLTGAGGPRNDSLELENR